MLLLWVKFFDSSICLLLSYPHPYPCIYGNITFQPEKLLHIVQNRHWKLSFLESLFGSSAQLSPMDFCQRSLLSLHSKCILHFHITSKCSFQVTLLTNWIIRFFQPLVQFIPSVIRQKSGTWWLTWYILMSQIELNKPTVLYLSINFSCIVIF